MKIIPESKVMVSDGEGNYYRTGNYSLFRRLFNYISENNVAMTTPVEARIENAQIKSYVGTKNKVKALQDQGDVRIVTVPQRTVVNTRRQGRSSGRQF